MRSGKGFIDYDMLKKMEKGENKDKDKNEVENEVFAPSKFTVKRIQVFKMLA